MVLIYNPWYNISMFGKEDIQRLEQKIDEMNEKIRIISERQNSQYTDIMLILKDKVGDDVIDNRSMEELYEEVKEDIVDVGAVSTSYIQRSQRLGYAKAVQIMDMLEERGVIGPGNGANPRKILIKAEE